MIKSNEENSFSLNFALDDFYYSKETKVEHSTWEHLRSKFAWGPSLDPKSKFLRVGLEYVFKVSQVSEMAMKKVKTTAINYAI